MKKNSFRKDERGQVLGLPMYLIVVMIVAVAVIAAVIVMIPQGTQTMNALVTDNAVISEDVGNASKFTFNGSYDVMIKVTTNDERADPIADATVTLVGAGVAESDTTDANGEVAISVTPTLGANVNEAHIKLTVKAAGFEDFEDDTAVTVYRL
ncbi:MAG: hypothetical protein U9R21_08230 [Candidatus Thermoplasmatota archaeon]|nr:hypothetical protein [Candidatus Thermoplasmatota archaeon]